MAENISLLAENISPLAENISPLADNCPLLAEHISLLAENISLLAQHMLPLAENISLSAENISILAENMSLLAVRHWTSEPPTGSNHTTAMIIRLLYHYEIYSHFYANILLKIIKFVIKPLINIALTFLKPSLNNLYVFQNDF